MLHPAADARHLFDRSGGRNETLDRLEALLPAYLKNQRWFGAKDQTIRRVVFLVTLCLQEHPFNANLSILRVDLGRRTEFYLLPLMLARGDEARHICNANPQAALAWFNEPDTTDSSLLHDATANPTFWHVLFRWWQTEAAKSSSENRYLASLDARARTSAINQVRIFWGEQSNSLAFFDDAFCLKLYRRLEQGVNPETELLEHLTKTGFGYAPRLYGSLTLQHPNQTFVLGTLQEALSVETDGWTYALDKTQHFLRSIAHAERPDDEEAPAWLEQKGHALLALARVLGTRTAELHSVLAAADTPDLRPEPGTPADTQILIERLHGEIRSTRRMLDEHPGLLTDVPDAEAWQRGKQRLDALNHPDATCCKIRVHGDYHLGQVVYANDEFYLLDFEGEPARSLDERRARDCALRDVAGMMRSLEYAALSAWQDFRAQAPEENGTLGIWVSMLVRRCEALFMSTYFERAASLDLSLPTRARRRLFVWAYLLQKALYEVRYELSHRPAWTWLPLRGLKDLLEDEV